LSVNYSDNNEVSNNLVENSVEPQSLPNHNDSFCCQNNSTPNNTIQNDINNFDLSYNDIHVINQNFYYHQNFKEQIEDEFNRTLNEFEHIEPFNRPLLPKQQSSKKFFAIVLGLMGAPGIARNQMGLLGLLSLMEASLV
jgi:hypothetical protein